MFWAGVAYCGVLVVTLVLYALSAWHDTSGRRLRQQLGGGGKYRAAVVILGIACIILIAVMMWSMSGAAPVKPVESWTFIGALVLAWTVTVSVGAKETLQTTKRLSEREDDFDQAFLEQALDNNAIDELVTKAKFRGEKEQKERSETACRVQLEMKDKSMKAEEKRYKEQLAGAAMGIENCENEKASLERDLVVQQGVIDNQNSVNAMLTDSILATEKELTDSNIQKDKYHSFAEKSIRKNTETIRANAERLDGLERDLKWANEKNARTVDKLQTSRKKRMKSRKRTAAASQRANDVTRRAEQQLQEMERRSSARSAAEVGVAGMKNRLKNMNFASQIREEMRALDEKRPDATKLESYTGETPSPEDVPDSYWKGNSSDGEYTEAYDDGQPATEGR